MPDFSAARAATAPTPLAVATGLATSPGKATQVDASNVRRIAHELSPETFDGMACDDRNRGARGLGPDDCAFSEPERRALDQKRIDAIGRMGTRYATALLHCEIGDVRKAMAEGKPETSWLIELLLAGLSMGFSAALVKGLRMLRAGAREEILATATEAMRAPSEFVETAGGALENTRMPPQPGRLKQLAARLPDAAITSPVGMLLDKGKAAASSALRISGTSHDDAYNFCVTLSDAMGTVLEHLATDPSATATDVEIVAQLEAARDQSETSVGRFRELIDQQVQQWLSSKLGRLGLHEERNHDRDSTAPNNFVVDRERKVVQTIVDGELRYAVVAKDHWITGAGPGGPMFELHETGDDFVESVVPRELEAAAIAAHVARWGALPARYLDWKDLF